MLMKIPFLNLEIVKSDSLKRINKRLDELEGTAAIRPVLEWQLHQEGAIIPNWATNLTIQDMYNLARISSVYRQVISSLQWEIFRRGAEFRPKFVRKCSNEECGKEFDYEAEICDECGAPTRKPDYSQIKDLEKRFKQINENKQSLIDVCKQCEIDLDIVDNAYFIIAKEYAFNENGEIIGGKIKEILRGDPAVMRILADRYGRLGRDESGRKLYVCPVHRERVSRTPGYCSCGKRLYQAFYVAKNQAGKNIYYLEDEVIHVSKFSPSLTYGYPPLLTLYQKIMIELNMDWYVMKSYDKGRSPNGWLFVKTQNVDSLRKMIEFVLEKTKKNPHTIIPIGVDSQAGGSFAEFIDLMKPLSEMQAIEFRNVIKREIGALFGVMPLFQADISTSGGLNNEGLQITVTNRAIETGQAIYNEKVFPEILRQFGVTDFEYVLLPSEEQDEMAELQREAQKIQNARMMLDMGFDVELDEYGEFKFSGEAKKPSEAQAPELFIDEKTQRFDGEPRSVRLSVKKGNLPKVTKETLRQASEAEKKLEKELKEIIRKLDFKRRPSEEQIKKVIAKLTEKFKEKAKNVTKKELERAYKKTIEEVEKEINMDLGFGDLDKNAVELLANSKVLTEAYDGMSKALSEKLNSIIAEAYRTGELDINKIVSRMKQAASEEEYKLRRIARTETTKVSNLARYNSYVKADPEGKALYKWIGPDDSRTTPICKEIKEKTKHGVTLQELKRIIYETAKKYNPDFEPGEFLPHINCRHTFVRVM